MGVAPGGAAQAMLGLDWQHRTGFAAAALTAAVPVIAMNTENIELAYHTRQQTAIWLARPAEGGKKQFTVSTSAISIDVEVCYDSLVTRPVGKALYRRTRLAVALVYGGLPVLLYTRLARPAPPPAPARPASLAAATHTAVYTECGAAGAAGLGRATVAWLEGRADTDQLRLGQRTPALHLVTDKMLWVPIVTKTKHLTTLQEVLAAAAEAGRHLHPPASLPPGLQDTSLCH